MNRSKRTLTLASLVGAGLLLGIQASPADANMCHGARGYYPSYVHPGMMMYRKGMYPHPGKGKYRQLGYGPAMMGYPPAKAYPMGMYGKYEAPSKTSMKPTKDIVDTAVAAGGFSTLAKALGAADLVDTLRGEGPFTVFAPTDKAFEKIPAADLKALLEDKEKLSEVLTYHVVAGKLLAKDIKQLDKAKTVQGQEITIDARYGVKADEARVIKPDILATNGVLHVIDKVIMPN